MPRSRMMDYLMRRDMRDRARSMRDMARRGGSGYSRMDNGYDGARYGDRMGNYPHSQQGYQQHDYGYEHNRQYGDGRVPFEVYGSVDMNDYARRRNSRGQYMSDRGEMMDGHYPYPYPMYMNDYGKGEKLDEEDLHEWYEDLCKQIPEQYKHLYKKENVENIAKQMNVKFENFDPTELMVTATMLASDFGDSISPSDIQRYVSLAKSWLEDKDSNLKGGMKLSAYYDKVVNG